MHKYIIEAIWTFFLVLVIALTGNPLAIGMVLVALVYMWGHISWAHYNPAVSLGARILKNISWRTLVIYRMFQFIGALLAGMLAVRLSDHSVAPSLGAWINVWQATVVELVFTFALVFVIFHVALSKKTQWNSYYGLAIWLTILAAAYAGSPISGGAFNPAVWIMLTAVDIFNSWEILPHIRIYLVGPILGGILATFTYAKIEAR